MKILDGKIVRDKIAEKLKTEISRWNLSSSAAKDSKPKLVIIQIGNLTESNAYIRQKVLFGQKIGAIVDHVKLDSDISQDTLISKLLTLNSNPSINGIIIQLPIPKHLDRDALINAIDPAKDVDGQTPTNIKLLWENRHKGYTPATTKGVLTLLDYYKIAIKGKKAVVVGRSSLVGKPTALALINRGATVTICHSQTNDLKQETKNADILVVAAGKPNLITKDHVSRGQIVIDVGINAITQNRVRPSSGLLGKPESEPPIGKLVGDVDFESVKSQVAAITPVPGGIGPMTVASLFENLLEAYTSQT